MGRLHHMRRLRAYARRWRFLRNKVVYDVTGRSKKGDKPATEKYMRVGSRKSSKRRIDGRMGILGHGEYKARRQAPLH